MAKDENGDRYKEGVDFEWVKGSNGNYRTRRFFTKKEKEERASGGAKTRSGGSSRGSSSSSAPTKSPRPKPRPDPKKEYSGRGDGRAETARRAADRKKTYSGRGDGAAETKRRAEDAKKPAGRGTAIPLAAAAIGARGRGGNSTPRLQITQRPIPFDSGVSRNTGVGPVRRPNPAGGGLYMLNQGRPGAGRNLIPPRMMSKGGMVKKGKC